MLASGCAPGHVAVERRFPGRAGMPAEILVELLTFDHPEHPRALRPYSCSMIRFSKYVVNPSFSQKSRHVARPTDEASSTTKHGHCCSLP